MLADSEVTQLTIIDRDTVSESNVGRQLFDHDKVGLSKAATLAEQLQPHTDVLIIHENIWFTDEYIVEPGSFIISCTDNHPARLAVLDVCDACDSSAVIAGNEALSADAYYYAPEFKGSTHDPRVRYPEIVTDKSDDPANPACNSEEVLNSTPQLASANFMSANFAMHLTQLWLLRINQYRRDHEGLPFELTSCPTRIHTVTRRDLQIPEGENSDEN
jgi:tRNA A37 threonylcarbamoyladenosine dehydratase